MSESNPNPYGASASSLQARPHEISNFVREGRVVEAGNGIKWLQAGFELFKRNPGIWIANVVILFVIFCVLAFIPILGSIATYLLFPIFGGGLMLGCSALDRGEEYKVDHLFAGFQQKAGKLLVIGGVYIAGLVVIGIVAAVFLLVIAGAAGLSSIATGGIAAAFGALGLGLLLVFLVAIAISIPLAMAIWFAPALVVFHDIEPIEAMRCSFVACLKNLVPFLIYGIVYFVLAIIASIPLMLGWLVLAPVIIASIYTAYQDIFLSKSSN